MKHKIWLHRSVSDRWSPHDNTFYSSRCTHHGILQAVYT